MNPNVYAGLTREQVAQGWHVLAVMAAEQARLTPWEYQTIMQSKALLADVLLDQGLLNDAPQEPA